MFQNYVVTVSILICFIYFISFVESKVAICVQGKSDHLKSWIQAYIGMNDLDHGSIADHATLFLFSQDESMNSTASCGTNGITCLHKQTNSWVEARNLLSISVHNHEKVAGIDHKYWLFIDANMLNVTCLAHQVSIQLVKFVNYNLLFSFIGRQYDT